MAKLQEVVVVDAVRSAIGKSGRKGMEKGGQLCQASAQDLLAAVMRGLLDRVKAKAPNFDEREIEDVLNKCNKIKTILDSASNITEKLLQIANIIILDDKNKLEKEIELKPINLMKLGKPEDEKEEDIELEEIEIKRMGAVELMTIVGSV